jgi:predicted GNAT family N-acyltransferase
MKNYEYMAYYDITAEIAALRESVFVDEQGFSREDERGGDEARYVHCCVYGDGVLIAYARVLFERGAAHIGRVAVRKEYRGRGYGSVVMRHAEREAVGRNFRTAELGAQLHAQGFYEKNGYVKEGGVTLMAGAPHIIMKKDLSGSGL